MAKTDTRKRCKHCKKRFTPANARNLYCSDTCRKLAGKSNQRAAQDADFPNLAFGSWLISECQRAGTVQVLQGVDLLQLYRLRCFYNTVNGFNVDEELCWIERYELSHICPAVGAVGFVGLLHPDNLVVAPGGYNRKRASHWKAGTGRFLRVSELRPEWDTTGKTKAEIAKLIKKLNNTFNKLLEEHKLSYKARVRYINHLIKMNVEAKATLEALPFDQLEELYEQHPKLPRKATMARRLARGATDPRKAESRYLAMSEADLQALYLKSPVSRSSCRLPRVDSYDVYCWEASRLGIALVDEWLFCEFNRQCWDALHCEGYSFDVNAVKPDDWWFF